MVCCGLEVAAAIAAILSTAVALGRVVAKVFTHSFGKRYSRRDLYSSPPCYPAASNSYSYSPPPPPAYSSPSTTTNDDSSWTTSEVVAVGLGSAVAGGVVALTLGPAGLLGFCLGYAVGGVIAACSD